MTDHARHGHRAVAPGLIESEIKFIVLDVLIAIDISLAENQAQVTTVKRTFPTVLT